MIASTLNKEVRVQNMYLVRKLVKDLCHCKLRALVQRIKMSHTQITQFWT